MAMRQMNILGRGYLVEIKYKVMRKGAKPPIQASSGAGGYDLIAHQHLGTTIMHHNSVDMYSTGIALEIPKNYVGLIIERSSLHRDNLNLANTIGVIDSDYRGEVKMPLKGPSKKNMKGRRVAQLLVVKAEELEFVEDNYLSPTDRGDGGFGSTGA